MRVLVLCLLFLSACRDSPTEPRIDVSGGWIAEIPTEDGVVRWTMLLIQDQQFVSGSFWEHHGDEVYGAWSLGGTLEGRSLKLAGSALFFVSGIVNGDRIEATVETFWPGRDGKLDVVFERGGV
jgi:hypothetical protein